MSVKEEIIKKAMKQIEKKLTKIDQFIDATPGSDIIEARQEAAKIIKEHKGDYKKIAELIGPLADREKKAFILARQQCKPGVTSRKIDEKVKLEVELSELRNELYYIERRKLK
jgi:pyridoxine 5'-phosphate synthase PdxJ